MLRIFQSVRGLADDSFTRLDKTEDLALEMRDLTLLHWARNFRPSKETSSETNIAHEVDYVLISLKQASFDDKLLSSICFGGWGSTDPTGGAFNSRPDHLIVRGFAELQELVRKVIRGAASKSCELDPAPTFFIKEFLEILLTFFTRLCNAAL